MIDLLIKGNVTYLRNTVAVKKDNKDGEVKTSISNSLEKVKTSDNKSNRSSKSPSAIATQPPRLHSN